MSGCDEIRSEFPALLTGEIPNGLLEAVKGHLIVCPPCAEELRDLEQTWNAMPAAAELSLPSAVRERVLAYGRRPMSVPIAPVRSVWKAIRGSVALLSLAVGSALVVLVSLHLRGALNLSGEPGAVPASVFFAAALAVALGALSRSRAPSYARAVLGGALGALGGYVLLSLISPIGQTVRFCRLTLFRGAVMSMGELCVLYAAMAILYGGVPMGIAAYLWRGRARDWRVGAVEAAIFVILVAPILLLQSVSEGWVITFTVLAALAVGSIAGGVTGSLARPRRAAYARS